MTLEYGKRMNEIQEYRCPICDISGNDFVKAHILPESLGFNRWTPVVKDKKCKCDSIMGKCVKALSDCNIYNYHNYKKNKKLNTSNLEELNKLDWKISVKDITGDKKFATDAKLTAKIMRKGKYGKLRIQPCPSGGDDKFKQFLDKKSDIVKTTATIHQNAYLVHFCLIHSLLLLDFNKKIVGKRGVLTKRSVNYIKMVLKHNCIAKDKIKLFKDNSDSWDYRRGDGFQYIFYFNEISKGGIIYKKDKMVGFICDIPTNIKYYRYVVMTSNWSISKEAYKWSDLLERKESISK